MSWKTLGKATLSLGAISLSLSPVFSCGATAQPQDSDGWPPPDYRGSPPPDYGDDTPPPPELAPPIGYDGTRPPPPPPGYEPPSDEIAMRAADDRYAVDAERWARRNCVKAHANPAAGAVVGGILGAIIGSGLAGRHDRGAGTLAGAAIGAMGGAAIAGSADSDATSPGCPPGYVVRDDAGPYGYEAPDYYYAAPPWYRPWVLFGGVWLYRPYPYHDWYYRTYRGHRGYYPRQHYPRHHYRGHRGDRRDGGHRHH